MSWMAAVGDFVKDIWGQDMANDRQEDMQSFNAEQAAINRAWEERMSNTRYQRSTADMVAAGINPMMMMSQGPGNSPSGSAASSGTAGNPGHTSVSAGLQTASQIATNDAQQEVLKAQADKTQAEANEIRERTPSHGVTRDLMSQQIQESKAHVEKLLQDVKTGVATATNVEQQTANLRELIPQIRATVDNLKAATKLHGAQTGLAVAQTGEARASENLIGWMSSGVKQRVDANLPALEAATQELERQARIYAQPGQANNAAAQDSLIGAIGAYLRALNPLTDVVGGAAAGYAVGASKNKPDQPLGDRKWPRKK